MESKIFMWIGVACVGLASIQVVYAITATSLGYFLQKLKLTDYFFLGSDSMRRGKEN